MLTLIVRKLGRHLLADEGIRELCDLQASVDPVVIGEGDVGHPLFFQPLIQHPRIGIAIGKLEAAENPFRGSIAEFRMNMEIDFRGHLLAERSVSCCPIASCVLQEHLESFITLHSGTLSMRRATEDLNELLIGNTFPASACCIRQPPNLLPDSRILQIGWMNADTNQRSASQHGAPGIDSTQGSS